MSSPERSGQPDHSDTPERPDDVDRAVTWRPATMLVKVGRELGESMGVVNPPVVRGSTVLHASLEDLREKQRLRAAGADRPVTYGLHGTATHHALFDALNALEGAHASWVVPSGMTACAMSILAFVQHGDHVLIPDSAYWPTRHFGTDVLPRYGVSATFYDPRLGQPGGDASGRTGRAAVEALLQANTRVLFMESPGSHTFEMQDVPLLAAVARERGVTTVIDNTWATPLYFQPLRHGVDVVVHAATKYIGGHSDLLLGTLSSNERSWQALRPTLLAYGLIASADDCAAALRGLRTLATRLARHRASADRVVAWLGARPEVERVLYPAHPGDPGHAIWKRDFTGACSLFGVVLKPGFAPQTFDAFIDGLDLFGLGASWGGYESLVMVPRIERSVRPFEYDGRAFRLSIGLEDPDDLIADLERGFARLRRA
jgi:cystathionine beta-lyase